MAAAALDKAALGIPDGGTWAAELPEELSEVAAQLQNGEVRWCSGLRIGDPVEIGAPHKHLSLLPPSNIIEWSTVSIIVFIIGHFPVLKRMSRCTAQAVWARSGISCRARSSRRKKRHPPLRVAPSGSSSCLQESEVCVRARACCVSLSVSLSPSTHLTSPPG